MKNMFCRLVRHIASSTGGLGLSYRAGQIGHTVRVSDGSLPLRRSFEAVFA